jgi:predicted nucleotidyltransferase
MMITTKYSQIHAIAEKYSVSQIYLFGSQAAQGNQYFEGADAMPDETSDLDIAVSFKNPPVLPTYTYGRLYRDMGEIFHPFNIDLIFMHELDILLQYEILKGIRIYEADELIADDFEEKIMKLAGDLFINKRIMDREIMEAIENGYFQFEYIPRS